MTNNKQQTGINEVEYIIKVNQFAKENNTDKPKQQTAIQWLYNELLNSEPNILEWNKLLEQAKEMEKQQIRKAYCHGEHYKDTKLSTDYYNETYGGGEQ